MTVANFAVAIAVPQLTRRFGNARLLATGVAVTLIGMAWLSRLAADTSYLTGIVLPMVLIGIGQGAAALGPVTAAGIGDVPPTTPAPHPGWSTWPTSSVARSAPRSPPVRCCSPSPSSS